MLSVTNQEWRNWADTSTGTPNITFYPESIEDVCTIVKQASKENRNVRVVGAGHSFTKLVATNDYLISLDKLSGIESIDEREGIVTVLGGTRLFNIGSELAKKGYSQENLGDINVQSIAGAISTGTHGTGIEFGNIPSQVLELTIVNAQGEIMVFSEENHSDLFNASLISLGMFGIIVRVKLRIIKSPVYAYESKKVKFSELYTRFERYIYENRHFECYIFPFSDLVQIKTMNITDQQPQKLTIHNCKNLLIENYLFYVLSETSRLIPKTSSYISKFSAVGVSSTKVIAESHQLFATPRLVRFREIEYCIPLEFAKVALQEIRATIEERKYKVHFPIECRTVKADDIWLSPSYQRDSFYIAFHMYKGMPYETYFRDMEAIMQKYQGRPHWGKMHHKSKEELMELYPKFNEFRQKREELDPNNLFMNPYMSSLFS